MNYKNKFTHLKERVFNSFDIGTSKIKNKTEFLSTGVALLQDKLALFVINTDNILDKLTEKVSAFRDRTGINKVASCVKQVPGFLYNKTVRSANALQVKIEKLHIGQKLTSKIAIGCYGTAVGLAIFAFAAVTISNSGVYSIQLHGEEVGYANGKNVIETSIQGVVDSYTAAYGDFEINLKENAVAYEKTDLKKKEVTFMTEEELNDALEDDSLFDINGWMIAVEGKDLVAIYSENQAEKVLEKVQEEYLTEGSKVLNISFKEEITIDQEIISLDKIATVNEAVALIKTGSKQPKVHYVEKGESMWSIASKNDVDINELQNLNPGFDPAKLKVGQALNLVAVQPYVTVLSEEVVNVEVPIYFGEAYESTNTLFKGDKKVKADGTNGLKAVEKQVQKENGVELTATILKEEVIQEPVAQIVLVGTKDLPASSYVASASGDYISGKGMFKNPVAGQLSSGFGSRGSGRHSGLDLRAPNGTPIYAAGSGVVTYSGWDGAYGNIVRIDHGNGYQTWYAHCSSLSAKVGDSVSTGQHIANVGITGRATGYHLHFEVRKNGVAQNPLNYL